MVAGEQFHARCFNVPPGGAAELNRTAAFTVVVSEWITVAVVFGMDMVLGIIQSYDYDSSIILFARRANIGKKKQQTPGILSGNPVQPGNLPSLINIGVQLSPRTKQITVEHDNMTLTLWPDRSCRFLWRKNLL